MKKKEKEKRIKELREYIAFQTALIGALQDKRGEYSGELAKLTVY